MESGGEGEEAFFVIGVSAQRGEVDDLAEIIDAAGAIGVVGGAKGDGFDGAGGDDLGGESGGDEVLAIAEAED